jgi:hypothetical protein
VAGGDSGSGSSSNLPPATDSGLCFVVFTFLRRLPSETLADPYIVGFRSRRGEPRENGRHRMLEAEKRLGGAAW